MLIYIAAPWADREYAKTIRNILRDEYGFKFNSTWIDTESLNMSENAETDWKNVMKADTLLLINSRKSEGKAVETGIALALDMDIVVIGKPTNIFHYLPEHRFHFVKNELDAAEVLSNIIAHREGDYNW